MNLSHQESFEDFFENSLSGHLILDSKGYVLRANRRFAGWIGCESEALKGTRFSDHMSIGAKIYYETHLAPLLKMQGFFDEIAVDLVSRTKQSFNVLINAYEHRDDDGKAEFIRATVYKATDRRIYETNLKSARDTAESQLNEEKNKALLREQFIAVLGHDLRNPLGAIMSGASILGMSNLPPRESAVVGVIKRSSERMLELIENVMDFARVRLGGGMKLLTVPVFIEPTLLQVIEELRAIWPSCQINAELHAPDLITCDAARIAQVLSNLLANAITHGSPDGPVIVQARADSGTFELSVINSGEPIPESARERLFEPFKRESERASQNGLGLGLYIAAEIARAHKGQLTVMSNAEETRFTFAMPIRSEH